VITGSALNDKIDGKGGNDALDGGAGSDQIDGGDGNDLIGGGAGSDKINGGAGDDEILSGLRLSVPQRVGPNDHWVAPSGAAVLISGAKWGVYVDGPQSVAVDGAASGPQDSSGDVVHAGAGNDRVVASSMEASKAFIADQRLKVIGVDVTTSVAARSGDCRWSNAANDVIHQRRKFA